MTSIRTRPPSLVFDADPAAGCTRISAVASSTDSTTVVDDRHEHLTVRAVDDPHVVRARDDHPCHFPEVASRHVGDRGTDRIDARRSARDVLGAREQLSPPERLRGRDVVDPLDAEERPLGPAAHAVDRAGPPRGCRRRDVDLKPDEVFGPQRRRPGRPRPHPTSRAPWRRARARRSRKRTSRVRYPSTSTSTCRSSDGSGGAHERAQGLDDASRASDHLADVVGCDGDLEEFARRGLGTLDGHRVRVVDQAP